MNYGLCGDRFDLVGIGIDKSFEQMDGRNADDGSAQFDLEHRRIDVREPFGLVRMVFQVHARDKGLIAANDDHDEQVGNHHHIDQTQDH